MHPLLVNLGIPIHTYGALVAAAFLLGIKVTLDRAARAGLDKDAIMNLALVVLISSIAGARLLYVAENWPYFRDRLVEIPMVHRGGLSYFGGFAIALFAAFAFARRKGLKILTTADVFMPGLALGQSIGRLGCYFNGCCFGKIVEGFGGVAFPRGSVVFSEQVARGWIPAFWRYSLPVIPAQLISGFADIALFCCLIAIDDRKKVAGTTLFSYLAGYGALRFLLEFLRADSPPLAWGWTLPQVLGLVSLFSGLAGLLRSALKRS